MFVDVDGTNVTIDELVDAFQELPHRLTNTSTLLVRWPDISVTDDPDAEKVIDENAAMWADALAHAAAAVGYGQMHTGVVRFRIGQHPVVTWAGGETVPPERTNELLQRALQAELHALLDWGRAIWRPTGYHYVLPSGQHAGAFIRVGDAFRTVRDVRVIASWLTPRLRDGLGIVTDSATLIPLVTDLRSLMEQRGWQVGSVETLDEYPRTSFDLGSAVRPLRAGPGGVLGLLSVSSSGVYRDLMVQALQNEIGPDAWSLVVIVSKRQSSADRYFSPEAVGAGTERVATWVAVEDGATDRLKDGSCRWCQVHDQVQLVRIDPMSFEALALPGHRLITPDVQAARASLGIWQSCDSASAVGVAMPPEAGPSNISRPKTANMSVIVDFSRLLEHGLDELKTQVSRRLAELDKSNETLNFGVAKGELPSCDGVLVSSFDLARPNFRAFFDFLMAELNLGGIEPTPVDLGSADKIAPGIVTSWQHGLLFTLGSVSGWSLRQLQLAAEDQWVGLHDRELSGLVLHGRPSTKREWVTLGRPLRDRLHAVWLTYLPWRSPLGEEQQHLFKYSANSLALSPEGDAFFEERSRYVEEGGASNWSERVQGYSENDGSPDPYSILWGLPPTGGGRDHVRTRSNYGHEVNAVTAYAAMGAAMHGARESRLSDDPRRQVFELPAISRMYYDGLLIACILRWCEPHETWWGDSDSEAQNAISELLSRTQDEGDQKVLFPELLLAASQGKIPDGAIGPMVAEIETRTSGWSPKHRSPIEVGLALIRAQGKAAAH